MINYYDNENSLVDVLNNIESFEIFKNGEKEIVKSEMTEFNSIKNKLLTLFTNSRLMPAFGVSLHDETLKEMKFGSWLKINFDEEFKKNGLPFNSLLFQLEEVQGFNLIRLYKNKYDGRCLYLDLDEQLDLMDLIR